MIAFWCCSASSDAHTWSVVAIGEGKKKHTEWRLGPGPMERAWEAGTTAWGVWSPHQKWFQLEDQLLEAAP